MSAPTIAPIRAQSIGTATSITAPAPTSDSIVSRRPSLTRLNGAFDEKAGMCGSVGDIVRHPRLNHRVDVQSGVQAEECGELLKDFFAARRV